jgi:hypothetical protein
MTSKAPVKAEYMLMGVTDFRVGAKQNNRLVKRKFLML